MGGARAKTTADELRAALDRLVPDGLESFEQELKACSPLPKEAPSVVAEWALAAGLAYPVEFDRVVELVAARGPTFVQALGAVAADYSRSERKHEAGAPVLRHLAERLRGLGLERASAMLLAPALQGARSRAEADNLLADLRASRQAILDDGGRSGYLEALAVYLGQHATRLDQTVELGEEAAELACGDEEMLTLIRLGAELPGTISTRQLACHRLPGLVDVLAEPLPAQVDEILARLLQDKVWPAALRCGAHLLRVGTSAQPDALRINLAICLLWLGDGEIGLTVLTTPSAGEMEVQRHYHRGLCLEGLNRYREAAEAYDQALALDPGHVWAWRRRARAMRESGRFELARQDADCLQTFDPASGRVALAMVALRDQAWGEAERLFSELTGTHGRRALFYRAVARHLQAKLKAAAQDYERLTDDFESCYNLAHVLALGKDWEGAERCYSAALRKEPGDRGALANRALARLERGATTAAEQDLSRLRRGHEHLPVDWSRWLRDGGRRPSPFDALVEPRGVPITACW